MMGSQICAESRPQERSDTHKMTIKVPSNSVMVAFAVPKAANAGLARPDL
jgi:hypothetical protein